ncbi:MAG: rubredoxin [Planctomycetes bacterium]|nr:rubredoxin [Planctomycetota bacterium]
MRKYWCRICTFVYDPDRGDPKSGVPPGTAFGDLPDNWVCPKCGASKEYFEPMEPDE